MWVVLASRTLRMWVTGSYALIQIGISFSSPPRLLTAPLLETNVGRMLQEQEQGQPEDIGANVKMQILAILR